MNQNSPNTPKPSLDATLERLWLQYYNQTLYKQGVISENERNRMDRLIRQRAAARER